MLSLSLATLPIRAAYSICTLYMMMILLRWLGPWLQVNLRTRRLRWIPALTDPLLNAIRRILPSMGPFDFGPIAALLLVWVIRGLATQLLASVTFSV